MTLLNNLTIITSANFERDCFVGNNRLLEMIAAIDTNITAFKPPSIPTDWQANQLAHHGIESLYTVYSPPPTSGSGRLKEVGVHFGRLTPKSNMENVLNMC